MSFSRKSRKPKNGCVLIADVGSFSSRMVSKVKTFAEAVQENMALFIKQKIFLDTPEHHIAIVLSGSESTDNNLGYKNITVLQNFQPVNWEGLKIVDMAVRTNNCDGDWMDALGVALDLIHNQTITGEHFDKTEIFFFTAFESPFKSSGGTIQAYITALQDKKTELVFVGSNVTEELLEDGEGKLSQGELVAYRIFQKTGKGGFMSFNEFNASYVNFTDKPKQGMAWNATLDIGSTIKIPVTGYIKVRKSENLKWKEETSSGEALVDKERVYRKEPTNAIVDKQDVIPSYKYGSTYIPILSDVENMYNINTGCKSFSVLAFVNPIPPQYHVGQGTMYFFPHKKTGEVDRSAQIALSALIYALEETGKVALVRRIYQSNSGVKLGVLFPRIKLKYECLVYHELPFSDDWRDYEFGPIVTPKNQPNSEQLEAIDLLIDKLDLSAAESRDEFSFDSTKMCDPYEEYIRNVIAFKALNPEDQLPDEIPPHVKMYLQPAPSMLEASKDVLDRIKHLFPLQVPERLKVNNVEAAKRGIFSLTVEKEEEENQNKKSRLDETGEIDLMSILGADKANLGTVNPVDDFSFLLEIGKKPVEKIYEEMEKIIILLLQDSGGTNIPLMTKARGCIQAYRKHALIQNRAADFNRWMERFKEQVISNYFSDFWQKYVADPRLGLITNEESSVSTVDQQQAEKFLKISTPTEALFDSDDDEALLNLI